MCNCFYILDGLFLKWGKHGGSFGKELERGGSLNKSGKGRGLCAKMPSSSSLYRKTEEGGAGAAALGSRPSGLVSAWGEGEKEGEAEGDRFPSSPRAGMGCGGLATVVRGGRRRWSWRRHCGLGRRASGGW